MSLRYLLPGICWLGAMILLFITPIGEDPVIYFDKLPARSLVHGIMFMGFAHIWLGACKKQKEYHVIKRNAYLVVFISAVSIALVSELLIFVFGLTPAFNFWNLGFDIIGACLGLITFRLLYSSCY